MNEPIRQGELNGIAWRSLTTKKQMRTTLATRKFNQYYRFRIELTLPEIIKILGFASSDQFVYAPVSNKEARVYIYSRAKYFNNVKRK